MSKSLEVMSRTRPGRQVVRGPDVAVLALSLVFAGVLVWTSSFPGAPIAGVVATGVAGAGAAVGWLRQLHRARVARSVAGVVSLAAVATAVLVSCSGLALQARFALGADDLAAAVAGLPAPATNADPTAMNPIPGSCPARVTGFTIGKCRTYAGAYLFLQSWNAISDDAGFAYSPQGLSPAVQLEEFRHLAGPWYTWRLEPMTP